MTRQELIAKMDAHQAWVPGRRIRLDFGSEGAAVIDGRDKRVTEEGEQADTVIGISWGDWQALSEGRLDPMSAYMSGRLRVAGDISDAIQLGTMLKKLKG
ncbi:MAG: SCP2 sterol-binding domain-containing protein [Sphingomicrobium sp.]